MWLTIPATELNCCSLHSLLPNSLLPEEGECHGCTKWNYKCAVKNLLCNPLTSLTAGAAWVHFWSALSLLAIQFTNISDVVLYNGVYCAAVQWHLLYSSKSTVGNDDHDDGDGVSCPMQTFVLTAIDGSVETIYNIYLYPNKNMQKVWLKNHKSK